MENVPKNVKRSAPTGTEWFGGSVDKITITLRIIPRGIESEKDINANRIMEFVGKQFEKSKRGWKVQARPCFTGNFDKQVKSILNKLPKSKKFWDDLNKYSQIDLFVGLFLERTNRGMEISPTTMSILGERNILLSFDIYGHDEK